MKRVHQSVLILSTVVASWLGMQSLHEIGHILGAFLTGAHVNKVVLNPLSFSRTDIGLNPQPLLVVWAGPIMGVLLPLILWNAAVATRSVGSFVFRFFAGFCCIANGSYIAVGSFDHIGDSGEMLTHGSKSWMLWLFGAITIPAGLRIWHGLGNNFGLGEANGNVNPRVAYVTTAVAAFMVLMGFLVGES